VLMLQWKTYMVQGRTRRCASYSCANSYYTMNARNATSNAPHSMKVLVTAHTQSAANKQVD
jgi:hypothetical protein